MPLLICANRAGAFPILKRVSPLSWEHINLTGIYSWDAGQQMPEGFRPLRLPGRLLRAA
ncbi:hypothetical protein QA648_21530 (plasmid) [Rhizobium sp. CB3171]|nr:hypothetical protein [Rhizobium sp. CB3171]WFU06674.1 hypothetical protein QA648_21530 [Rhizobium sp. CB3171]